MHRILLREVVIDVPSRSFARTKDFWAATLMATPRDVPGAPEFTGLAAPAARSWVGLQEIGDGPARYHLDIETDDVEAEVARLVSLGAEVVARGPSWTVMRDPAGLLFDVVAAESPWFDEQARQVPEP